MISAMIPYKTRIAVYKREGWECALCGDNHGMGIHHCIPRSEGGSNEMQNLICLCNKCHALAHGTKLFETDMTQEDVQEAIWEYLADFYADELEEPGDWCPYEGGWKEFIP